MLTLSGPVIFDIEDPTQVLEVLDNGDVVAEIFLKIEGDTIVIEDIDSRLEEAYFRKQGTLGVSRIREVLRLLKKIYPQTTKVAGLRVSGARLDRPQRIIRNI